MKIHPKHTLKSSDQLVDTLNEGQLITHSGKLLTVHHPAKNSFEFIPLARTLKRLIALRCSINKKAVYTVEETSDGYQACQYSLKGDRKAIALNEANSFISAGIQKATCIGDYFDPSLIYVLLRKKEDACLMAVDFSKQRVMTTGYCPAPEDVKPSIKETMELSVCTKTSLKLYRCASGAWEHEDISLKKLPHLNLVGHQPLPNSQFIIAMSNSLYLLDGQSSAVQVCQFAVDITEIIKIGSGLIVLLADIQIKYLLSELDDGGVAFTLKATIRLPDVVSLQRLAVNAESEEVFIKARNQQIFRWQVDSEIKSTPDPINQIFTAFNFPQSKESVGAISMASQKRFCLQSGSQTVSLWDVQKGELILSKDYFLNNSDRKAILTSCINPNGNSFMLAFDDKIRIELILMTDFKTLCEFPLKKVRNVVYSHGGQFAACVYGRANNTSLTLLNTLRMTQIATYKLYADAGFVIFNELDDSVVATTASNVINTYKIGDSSKSSKVEIPETINLVRFDYNPKRLLVSADSGIYIVSSDQIVSKITVNVPQFYSIFPLHKNYFVTDYKGNLHWSTSFQMHNSYEIGVFTEGPISLYYRNGIMLCTKDFQNITAYELSNYKSTKDTPMSDNIVFIDRQYVQKILQKMQILENDFENLQSASAVSIDSLQVNHRKAVEGITTKLKKEIQFLNDKYQQLQQHKSKHEKQSERMFERVQTGQVKSVLQLQKMYDKKLKLEKERFMELQQSYLEQKLKYDEIIASLEKKHHADIQLVRDKYRKQLKEECARMDEIKADGTIQKERLQSKIIGLEEETQLVITELQQSKDSHINALMIKIIELEDRIDKGQVDFSALKNQFEENQRLLDEKNQHVTRLDAKLAESNNRISILQQELSRKERMLHERDSLIEQQTSQVNRLEKAKYVLSFRAAEIRKEVQPKEQLAEKLKTQLFKLDDELKKAFKDKHDLGEKLEKVQKLYDALKKQTNAVKATLKVKEKAHSDILYEIYSTVTGKDSKEWNSALVKLYQNFVKCEISDARTNPKAERTAQELNKHLIHVEQTLAQFTSGNERLLKAKEKEVVRKMKENAQLVYDLNVMRKNENGYRNKIEIQANEIASLRRQLQETHRESTRAHTAKTGHFTRRGDSQEKERTNRSELNILEGMVRDDHDLTRRQSRHSNRVSSASKTMFVRQDRKERNKFFELAKELQNAKSKIVRQQRMIDELNKQLLRPME